MDGSELPGDDRTFRANFTGDGVEKLKENVKAKLMELMGDYLDDTLVEYVVVLLRNGRRKDEAGKELNVFLGDETVPFVSWLWDHLSSNFHIYVEGNVSSADDLVKTKSLVNKRLRRHDSYSQHRQQHDPQYEKQELAKLSGSQHEREWRGLVQEDIQQVFFQSTLNENHLGDKIHQRINLVGQSHQQHTRGRKQNDPQYEKQELKLSKNQHNRAWRGLRQEAMQQVFLQSTLDESHLDEKIPQRTSLVVQSHPHTLQAHKKRIWQGERQPTKRDTSSHPSVGPPCRLLQFALRDAVRNVQQTSSRTDPAPKRLCPMANTPSADYFLEDGFQMTIPVSGATAEAVEDVLEVKSLGNAFGRQGHDMDTIETLDRLSYFSEDMLEEKEFDDIFQIPGPDYPDCYEKSEYDGELIEDITMLDGETGASNNDGYSLIGSLRHPSGSSATENKNPFTLQYSVSKDTDGVKQARLQDQEPPATAAGIASQKVVNISVNVNTWKPRHWHYGSSRNLEVESPSAGVKGDLRTEKHDVQLSNTAILETDNAVTVADVGKEFRKTVPSTPGPHIASHPCDDADSRIIFISNVHFAATKDALSHHFSKYGEVQKVIIVTDVTTKQPKGSAFVEFLRKESAERALSLNGTYFMSRVLKVVRSDAARHEGAQPMVCPRVARTSSVAPMLQKAVFPRDGNRNVFRGAFPSSFRASHPFKPKARSLQWKRDSSTPQPAKGVKTLLKVSTAQPTEGVKSLQKASLPPRSFTYIRSISKPEPNSGAS